MAISINGTTGISGVNGSAGTPALQGSDADTGIFLAAGQVSASVNGTAGNVPLVSGTAQASTSGTSIDFTGIPSWVKRVTVMFNGVSTNGTSTVVIQLGSGSFTTSGYLGSGAIINNAAATSSSNRTVGLPIDDATSANAIRYGSCIITNINGNAWVSQAVIGRSDGTGMGFGAGSIALSGTLDRVRITTVNGTDTFDAGTINIMYE